MKHIPLVLVMLITATLTYAGLSRMDSIRKTGPVLASATTAPRQSLLQPDARIQALPMTTVHIGRHPLSPAPHLAPVKHNGNKRSA